MKSPALFLKARVNMDSFFMVFFVTFFAFFVLWEVSFSAPVTGPKSDPNSCAVLVDYAIDGSKVVRKVVSVSCGLCHGQFGIELVLLIGSPLIFLFAFLGSPSPSG